MDLVAKFWNYCHTLRHEGVEYSDYIEELTYLLFLKIAEERVIKIPDGCKWKDLIVHDQESLLTKYNQILSELSKEKGILGDIFSQPIAKLRNPSSLKKLLSLIDEVNWSEYNEDILGSMFEGLLERAANESKKGAGQYFTPRPLIEAIIKVMKPDPFESKNFSVSDVACGTAGFLIYSYEWWKSNNELESIDQIKREKLFNLTYFGQELVVRPRRMAQMNLYLHGIEPQIKLGDTIYEPYNPITDKKYSCILTNPPFGSKGAGADQIPIRADFPIKTSNKQINFVQHVYTSLEDNGRAAIVLPDNILTEDKAIELWKFLIDKCNIHTIMRLPDGTFNPYANVKAIVVFLQKSIPTKNIWIFDARTNVSGITKKGRPLTKEHFYQFVECYGDDPNGRSSRKDLGEDGRFRKFSLKQIIEQNFKLDISWMKDEIETKNINNFDSEDLIKQSINQVNEMLGDLKNLLNLIGNQEV